MRVLVCWTLYYRQARARPDMCYGGIDNRTWYTIMRRPSTLYTYIEQPSPSLHARCPSFCKVYMKPAHPEVLTAELLVVIEQRLKAKSRWKALGRLSFHGHLAQYTYRSSAGGCDTVIRSSRCCCDCGQVVRIEIWSLFNQIAILVVL